ncbi:hypothetical protein [Methylocaldum sp. GT1TLB]|uniref:hypothetical protein n=1 Tax=Methylocaldum sp. GT1TLB TaxID=3438965 RepID=UPI003DA15166
MNSRDSLESSQPLVDVVLYLRGHSLDPALVSATLGVDASKARMTGEKWRTRTDKEVVTKIGFWKLISQTESTSLSDRIGWLRQKLVSAKCSPSDIPGVQEVELSIFVALGSDEEGAVDYESQFTAEDLAWLSSIGATVSFSFTYVKD